MNHRGTLSRRLRPPCGPLAADESRKFGPLPELDLFRVTSRSTGGSGTALVILQSTVQRRFTFTGGTIRRSWRQLR